MQRVDKEMNHKVTLITGHYWNSKRRAGFHHIANALQELGHEVLFFTAPVSKLHELKGDHIVQYAIKEEANRVINKGEVLSYLHYTPWHVANTRFALTNLLTTPVASLYQHFKFAKEAAAFIAESAYIIFESTPGLLLFDKVRELNPKAKYIYRVSDDLRFLNVHPALIKYENRILLKFDLVSIVSSHFHSLFKTKNVKLHFHGINKQIFNEALDNPYPQNTVNLVFVGNAYFDVSFIEIASELFPDYKFHIIGPIQGLPDKQNIIKYGELPFQDTVKYIRHASAGLHTLEHTKGAEGFTDTLKVHQYTYCKLPIVAPEFLRSNREHAFYYQSGQKDSIRLAVTSALKYPKENIDAADVLDWKELAGKLLTE
ncbi:glucuronosyltransferase [Flammeovirgaceae bacterium 311]|nr:glucuronosyltransferase [Flammeovirgaceae bacterium 311]